VLVITAHGEKDSGKNRQTDKRERLPHKSPMPQQQIESWEKNHKHAKKKSHNIFEKWSANHYEETGKGSRKFRFDQEGGTEKRARRPRTTVELNCGEEGL